MEFSMCSYEMAESLDGQTKQMANDLKKIITHLNIINKEQDENNPVSPLKVTVEPHLNNLFKGCPNWENFKCPHEFASLDTPDCIIKPDSNG
jgi:hypothetical protein